MLQRRSGYKSYSNRILLNDGQNNLVNYLPDGSNRCLISDSVWVVFLTSFAKGNYDYIRMNEKILSDHYSFMFPPNHYMFEAFDSKVCQMIEGGIIDFAIKSFPIFDKHRDKSSEGEHKILTMEHLGIWFNFLIGLLLLSTSVLIVEILVKYIERKVIESTVKEPVNTSSMIDPIFIPARENFHRQFSKKLRFKHLKLERSKSAPMSIRLWKFQYMFEHFCRCFLMTVILFSLVLEKNKVWAIPG